MEEIRLNKQGFPKHWYRCYYGLRDCYACGTSLIGKRHFQKNVHFFFDRLCPDCFSERIKRSFPPVVDNCENWKEVEEDAKQ